MPSSPNVERRQKEVHAPISLEHALKLSAPEITQLRQAALARFTALKEKFELGSEQLSLVNALSKWAIYVSLSSGARSQEAKVYAESLGFPKLKTPLELEADTRKTLKTEVDKILKAVISGRLSASEVCSPENAANLFPFLPSKAVKLLPGFIARQAILDATNFNGIKTAFPYSLDGVTFFKHFVTGRCEDPQTGLRHLRCAAPFFVNIKSIIEGLRSSGLNAISITSEIDSLAAPKTEEDKKKFKEAADRQKELFECLPNLVNNSHLFEANATRPVVRLRSVQVPRLPKFRVDVIEEKQFQAFAQELYDWLFFGKRDGELLNLKTLPVTKEASLKDMQTSLTRVNKRLQRHLRLRPGTEQTTNYEKWNRTNNTLLAEQERYKDEIKDLVAERNKAKPVIHYLEADKKLLLGVARFRKECGEAIKTNCKLVLTFLKGVDEKSPFHASFLEFLDDAQFRPKSDGAKLLSASAILMTENVANRITSCNPAGPESLAQRHHRRFFFSTDTLNLSARLISLAAESRRNDPRIDILVRDQGCWTDFADLTTKQMTTLVRDACAKPQPALSDYLEYTFQHCSTMSEDQLFLLLSKMYQLGVRDISETCQQISVERFNHRPVIWEAFKTFANNFRPKLVGDVSEIFDSLTELVNYLAVKTDSHAMQSETHAMAQILAKEGAVVIVDGTSYNQTTMLPATADDTNKPDVANEASNHISPSDRLFRSFSRVLMEGLVPDELKNRTIVSLAPDDKFEEARNAMIKRMLGVDLSEPLDISTLNQVLAQLAVYDSRAIISLDVEEIEDTENYREFLELLKQYGFKLIITAREPIPGFAQVRLEHFADEEIPERILADEVAIRRDFKIAAPLEQQLLQLIVKQVAALRLPDQDPLELSLDVLKGAANRAASLGRLELTKADVVEALPAVFELPDHHQITGLVKAVDRFTALAPLAVLGQPVAIKAIAQKCLTHFLRVRTTSRPLTFMLPGPTGVGKTELMEGLAKTLNIPFFPVEGAEFSEPHSLARLVGSPSGYKGPDKGILVDWCQRNTVGLVFFDEGDKMHPVVLRALMNFWDKGRLTAGDGTIVTRTGLIIATATNAGAELLRHDMTPREVKDILANAFVDSTGKKVPELIRRFDCMPVLSIELDDFMGVINLSLDSLTNTFGMIQAGIEVVQIDPSAAQIIYELAKDVCIYEAKGNKIGFSEGASKKIGGSDTYFDMRFVSRALETAAGSSIVEVVRDRYTKPVAQLSTIRRMRLVGDLDHKRILLLDE